MIIQRVKKPIISVLFIIALFPAYVLHPDTLPQFNEYLFSDFSTENGLPQNTVYSIAGDQDGFIWVGTDRGMARFDGTGFRHFNMYNTPEIRSNSITAILLRKDGALLIGTYGGGAVIYRDEEFSPLDLGEGSHAIRIWRLVEDSKSNLWVVTTGDELIRSGPDGGLKKYFIEKQYGKITSLIETSSNRILVSTERHVLEIAGSKVSTVDISKFPGSAILLTIQSLSADELHICTDNGLFIGKLSADNIELISQPEKNNIIRKTYRDRSGNTWIISDKGLGMLDHDRISPFHPADEFFQSPLMTMYQGPEGNLWIGSSGRGLRVLRKRNFFAQKLSRDFFNGQVNSVHETSGHLLTGTQSHGLLISKGDRYSSFSKKDGLASNTVNTVLSVSDRLILAGTKEGLSIIRNPLSANKNRKIINKLTGIEILSLYMTSEKQVLIGTSGHGLYVLGNNNPTRYGHSRDPAPFRILSISECRDTRLLLGTDIGIQAVSTTHMTISTLPGTENINGPVFDIAEDQYMNLWIGTQDHGLVILNGGKLIYTGEINNLLLTPVFRLINDRKNRVWMSSNNGILMLRKDELYRFLRTVSNTLNPIRFSQNDGIATPVFSGEIQPAGHIDTNGIIYFPSKGGVTRFDTTNLSLNTIPPKIKFHRLITDTGNFDLRAKITLSHQVKKVSVTFSIISFTNSARSATRLELSGNNKKWGYTSLTRNSVTYGGLSPGKYRLNITASNCDGIWNYKGASIEFQIRNPIYNTFVFYMLLLILLYTLSPFIYKWTLTRRKKKAEETGKYKDSKLTTVDSHIYIQKLKQIVEREKLYLDPNIKIRDISSRMGVPRKVLSQLINDVLDENFKNFINRYRIEDAKKQLINPENKDYILLRIIYDVGFNSKSVFNAAFKKHTGMTPSEYRKKHSSG